MEWEYQHVMIEAKVATNRVISTAPRDTYYSFEGSREVKSEFKESHIADQLNKYGREGWELVQMEPRWSWYVSAQAGTMERYAFSHPDHIVNYFSTFKRPKT